MIFADLANVAANSEIRFNPSHTVFSYSIKAMGNVSNRILKICIDITSFTNSLIQNYGLADPEFYLPNKEDLYLTCRL